MTQLTVRYDGLLRITDPDAFRETLIRGIGPAKAFGCGLMLVKRVV
jgi:CRISPR system Cascade subunit CasE